jgi:putative transposase
MDSNEPLLAGGVYHIYTHANGSENLFLSDDNFNFFLRKYGEHIYPIADTYAYCLMPNHLHLMVRMKEEAEVLKYLEGQNLDGPTFKKVAHTKAASTLQGFETLGGFSKYASQQFSNLFNAYTQSFNKMYGRKGSLFMPNFKRRLVEDEHYFTRLIAYIHNNPVHHGFVQDLFDWPHSSIQAYLMDKPSKLDRKYLQDWFGNKESLLLFHQQLNPDPHLFEF